MLDLNKPDVGCRIFTSRMSDGNKSDVRFLQVVSRILTSRMSDFYKSEVECRILKVGCRMAPVSFRRNVMQSVNFEEKLGCCGIFRQLVEDRFHW